LLTFLPYLLIFLGFGLGIWSIYLQTPVNNLPFSALVHDTSNYASSIVERLFNNDVEQYQMQYDVFWNLELPGILLIIAGFFLIMAFKMILSELKNNTHSKIDFILKGAILSLTLVLIIVFLINGGKLFLLSLLVLAAMLIVLMILPFLIFMLFKPEKTNR